MNTTFRSFFGGTKNHIVQKDRIKEFTVAVVSTAAVVLFEPRSIFDTVSNGWIKSHRQTHRA